MSKQKKKAVIEAKKERVTVCLSSEVVEYFRATGEGWKDRIDKVLLDYVRSRQ